jgi:hypothetical protein
VLAYLTPCKGTNLFNSFCEETRQKNVGRDPTCLEL